MEPFGVRSRRNPPVLHVQVDGYLNDLAGEPLEKEIEAGLNDGLTTVVIDFDKAGLVNSIGISLLVGAVELVRKKGGSMIFSQVSPVNRQIFEMAGMGPFVSFVTHWEEGS